MKIVWEISPQNIQSTTQCLSFQHQGYQIASSELCWATLSLHDRDGKTCLLGEVAALDFLLDWLGFLSETKSLPIARGRMMDANQSYGVKLEKEGAVLKMTLPPYAHPVVLSFDFEQSRNKVRYYGGLFLLDYLRLCPALQKYEYLDSLRRFFNVRP